MKTPSNLPFGVSAASRQSPRERMKRGLAPTAFFTAHSLLKSVSLSLAVPTSAPMARMASSPSAKSPSSRSFLPAHSNNKCPAIIFDERGIICHIKREAYISPTQTRKEATPSSTIQVTDFTNPIPSNKKSFRICSSVGFGFVFCISSYLNHSYDSPVRYSV